METKDNSGVKGRKKQVSEVFTGYVNGKLVRFILRYDAVQGVYERFTV